MSTLWALVLVAVFPAAASDADADASRRQPEAGSSDAAAACEAGSCPAGQICSNNRCIAPLEDKDGDGIPAGSDCDDGDKAVSTTAQRACKSECAEGLERCVMGEWQACDAAESGDLNGAERAFATALSLHPFHPVALKRAGILYASHGRFTEARALFGRFVRAGYEDADVETWRRRIGSSPL